MLTYYILLGVLAILACLFQIGGKNRKKDLIFLLIVFVILATTSALRYSTGYDYSYTYAPGFEEVLNNPDISLFGHHYEPGYMLLEKMVAFFSSNYQMIFVVTSVLIIGLFCINYAKYSSNVYLSVILFILLSEYYCSMNFIRQTIAGVIALFAIPFLKKKKFFPYLLIVLVASTFHKSALILIPFFFINLIPLTKIVFVIYCAVTAVLYFNTERIMNFVTQYWYQGYHLDNVHVQATFEWPFAVAMLIEFLIVFLGASKLTKKDKSNYVYVNYAFFAFFFTLMGTRHSILDRLSVYFEFAFPLSIPLLYTCLKESLPSWWSLFDKHPEEKENRKNAAVTAGFLAFVLCGGLAIHQYALTMDHHGVVPYRCILNQPFYQEYLENLENPQDEPAEPVEEEEPVIEEPVDTPPSDTSTQPETTAPEEGNELPDQTDVPEGMPVEVPLS